MFKKYRFLCSQILQGKSVLRAYLNLRLREEAISGKVIDIGGGKNADYLSFMERAPGASLQTFDIKAGQKSVDFETDSLPADDGVYDTVLFLNVMEHIFNYQHIANEVVRIVKPGGQLIGFVPFLMWYHPDHSDYFRYTHEAIQKILETAGATDIRIEPIAQGPFTAAAHMKLLSIPKPFRVFVFTTSYLLDLFYKYMGRNTDRYALGYLFIISK